MLDPGAPLNRKCAAWGLLLHPEQAIQPEQSMSQAVNLLSNSTSALFRFNFSMLALI